MDLDQKQWEHHHHHHHQQQQLEQDDDESEDQQEHTPAKLPRLPLPPPHPRLNTNNITQNNNDNNNDNKDHPPPLPSSSSAGSTLPLFVPDHPSPPNKTHPFEGMWSYFSMAQWQEMELQVLIYRYMLFGAVVPPEFLHPIKKSLVHQPSSFSHHQPHLECFLRYPQSQPFRFQAGYWGSASTDPEPGRCRRTDGKKWRCSRDVVPGHKYCERHVHRGRNRSRKPVEIPPTHVTRAAASPTSGSIRAVNSGYLKSNTNSVTVAATGASHFAVSGTSGRSPIDLFQMNRSQSGPIPKFRARDDSSRGQVLRHFLDDWPRPLQEHTVIPSTGLSMSTARNSSSDVSLKLSTGDGEWSGTVYGDSQRARTQGGNWSAGWSPNRVVSMGGPLAEALRSSVTTNHSLPTSVLHELTCGLTSETSRISHV